MSGLQERIAAVLQDHRLFEHDWGVDGDCTCGFMSTGPWDDFAAFNAHVAEAVVQALNLTEQWTWSWPNGSEMGVPGFGYTVDTREEAAVEADPYMTIVHRWVTNWEPS